MTELQLEALEDHVIVLGYDAPTEPVVEELRDRSDLVILTPDSEVATRLRERGHMVRTRTRATRKRSKGRVSTQRWR